LGGNRQGKGEDDRVNITAVHYIYMKIVQRNPLKTIKYGVGENRRVLWKSNRRDEFNQSTLYVCMEISQ
jgi:hypothetical protein